LASQEKSALALADYRTRSADIQAEQAGETRRSNIVKEGLSRDQLALDTRAQSAKEEREERQHAFAVHTQEGRQALGERKLGLEREVHESGKEGREAQTDLLKAQAMDKRADAEVAGDRAAAETKEAGARADLALAQLEQIRGEPTHAERRAERLRDQASEGIQVAIEEYRARARAEGQEVKTGFKEMQNLLQNVLAGGMLRAQGGEDIGKRLAETLAAQYHQEHGAITPEVARLADQIQRVYEGYAGDGAATMAIVERAMTQGRTEVETFLKNHSRLTGEMDKISHLLMARPDMALADRERHLLRVSEISQELRDDRAAMGAPSQIATRVLLEAKKAREQKIADAIAQSQPDQSAALAAINEVERAVGKMPKALIRNVRYQDANGNTWKWHEDVDTEEFLDVLAQPDQIAALARIHTQRTPPGSAAGMRKLTAEDALRLLISVGADKFPNKEKIFQGDFEAAYGAEFDDIEGFGLQFSFVNIFKDPLLVRTGR